MADTPAKASTFVAFSRTPDDCSKRDLQEMMAEKTPPESDLEGIAGIPIIATSSGEPVPRKVTPVPMLPSEIVRIETAMFFAQVSDKTIRIWAHKDGIGRQAEKHSPLQISLPALLMKVDGEMVILERLREGQRNHPTVVAYLQRAISLLEAIRGKPHR